MSSAAHDREAEGLQALERIDYPEVSAVYQREREAEGLQAVEQNDKEVVPPHGMKTDSAVHTYSARDFDHAHAKHQSDPWTKEQESKALLGLDKRRKCGLKKSHVWLLGCLLALLVTGAVLGGTLGTLLRKSKDDATPDTQTPPRNDTNVSTNGLGSIFAKSHARNKTGLALLTYDDGTVLMYYMDENSNIVEAEYRNGSWLAQDGRPENVNNITSEADGSSPIAAIHYDWAGTKYRQIFFYDSKGQIHTMNLTNDGPWGEPYIPFAITTASGAKGLAACVGTSDDGPNGILLYLPSELIIQEFGFGFDSTPPKWQDHAIFPGSDPKAGVSCEIVGRVNRVYYRDNDTSLLHQKTWDYDDTSAVWTDGPWSNSTLVAKGGSIATTSDGVNTDYLFFQGSNGAIMHGLFTGSEMTEFKQDVSALNAAAAGSYVAAAWSDQAVMLNQAADKPRDLMFSTVSRNGDSENGTVVAT